MKKIVFGLALLILPLLQQTLAAGSDVPASWRSEYGHFQISYKSQLDPIVINQMHSWILHVTDADGKPVTGADIMVKGGMPAHNHGLATTPTVESRGNGDYLLQGLRFHMMGYWELTLSITANKVSDQVVITLEL